MIRRLLLAAIVGIMSLPMVAQDDDDMYFVPKKQSKDVIEFEKGDGTYDLSALDSTTMMMSDSARYFDGADDEFVCSRRMQRFDDFYCPSLYRYWDDPFWYGSYGWYSPYRSSWYWRWYGYNSWYSPWYYSWYNPWYNPWYYDCWGWNYPYWAGVCHTFTTLIVADQTRHATSLRAVSAAAHDSATATPRHAHSAIHTDSATRHATTRASTTTAIKTSSSTVVPTMLSRNIATTASAAIVEASAEAASVEAIAAVVASAVVAVAVSAVEDNKGGSPSITI